MNPEKHGRGKSPLPDAGAGSGVLQTDPISWRRGNRDKTRIGSSPASGCPGGHFKALEEFKEWLEIWIGLLPLENDIFDHYLNLLELGKGK